MAILSMAEREGFEPSVELPPHLISSQAHSAALSSLRDTILVGRIFVWQQAK